MRVLLTGVAGLIGSHLAEHLLDRGDEVVGFDNFVSGSRRNIAALDGRDGFGFHEGDVADPWPDLGSFDAVLHLASPASPVDFGRIPVEILRTGSLGTFHALELAAAQGARCLVASTSEVYGEPLVHPQHESYFGNVNPVGPRSCYDEAKRFTEAATMAYRRSRGADTVIIRIFNTYGPRMRPDDGRVVSTFVSQALAGEPITIFGVGSQTRSFCYVDDLVRGIVAAVESDVEGPVNLGNPAEFTVREVAEMVLELTGADVPIEMRPLPQDDPTRRRPDITTAQTALGWQPQVPLREGLARTVEYFRSRPA
ncbi:MAG: UDP-glucuronic acid decarboxylase family protein [Actinomycetes bacterium]